MAYLLPSPFRFPSIQNANDLLGEPQFPEEPSGLFREDVPNGLLAIRDLFPASLSILKGVLEPEGSEPVLFVV